MFLATGLEILCRGTFQSLGHQHFNLDKILAWAKHMKSKRKELNLKAKQMNWLLGR
jgi:hypothetical protein